MELRVIGGIYGKRRLAVPNAAGLRPTGNRIRETLFNWIADEVAGARVLDLFAGTGALGIEALSRGAAHVVFVERADRLAAALRDNLARLGAENARVLRADARQYLSRHSGPFDIVFLDPPFRSAIIGAVCAQLASEGWLAPGGLVYMEYEARSGRVDLPSAWSVVRERQAGGVGYALARRDEANAER